MRVGQFDAAFPPALTVRSGDSVAMECVAGRAAVLPAPGSGLIVPDALAAVTAAQPGPVTGHTVTGPVAIEVAK